MQLRLTHTPGPMRCAACGYNLSGVGTGQVISECPSCGTTFDPGDGARPRRWPATWKVVLSLCGGMMVLGALYLLAWIVQRQATGGGAGGKGGSGGSSFSKELVVILDQCVLAVWFVVPVCVAMYLAHRYAYRGERWTVGLGLAVGGIVGNTVLALCAMLAMVLAGR